MHYRGRSEKYLTTDGETIAKEIYSPEKLPIWLRDKCFFIMTMHQLTPSLFPQPNCSICRPLDNFFSTGSK